jgi:hypothetical protein
VFTAVLRSYQLLVDQVNGHLRIRPANNEADGTLVARAHLQPILDQADQRVGAILIGRRWT